MNPDFGRSDIFELIAENDVRFFVHKDILARQSEPFREAIEGVWKEATDRKINLCDWDEDTISRLVQFLYTGDYRYPDPTPISPHKASSVVLTIVEPEEEELEAVELEAVEPEAVVEVPKSLNNRPLTPLHECLPTRRNDPVKGTVKLADFDLVKHDFKVVLLSHAKVYVLAHYKSVEALQTLALEYLIMTLSYLSPVQPGSHIPKNIIDLATYAYANTDSLSGSEEPLRRIVSQFIALNLPALHVELEAVGLINKGGDFVRDVMAKACRRIAATPHSNTRFISKLRVETSTNSKGAPPDHVKEVYGSSSNLRYPLPRYTWLVPEYTTIAKDACTGFKLCSNSRGRSSDYIISSYHTRYLDEIKDQRTMEKVTEVALVRSKKLVGLDSVPGYDGITSSINHDSSGGGGGGGGGRDYLYLIWKSVKTSPV